jgi:hypothetical protein
LRFPVRHPAALLEGYAWKYRLQGKVWGCKIKHWHLTKTQAMGSATNFLQAAVSNGWLIVYLKRENFVKQAVAGLARKCAKGSVSYHEDTTARIQIRVHDVEEYILVRQRWAEVEERILSQIPALKLVYERDILDQHNRQLACDTVFANLGLSSCSVTDVEVKTDPDDLHTFIENADELERRLAQIGYCYHG